MTGQYSGFKESSRYRRKNDVFPEYYWRKNGNGVMLAVAAVVTEQKKMPPEINAVSDDVCHIAIR